MGITKSAYAAYEESRSEPCAMTLWSLAIFFNTTTDEIIGKSIDKKFSNFG